MRNVQSRTRGGGECATGSAAETAFSRGSAIAAAIVVTVGANTATRSAVWPLWRSGCDGTCVRCADVSQHVLFAQQAGRHGCVLGAFTRMQGDSGKRTVAAPTEPATMSDSSNLPTITLLSSTTKAARDE